MHGIASIPGPRHDSAMSEPRTLYTIGHSTRTIEEFIALLREHAIELLVDVRRFPGSRRHPQFGSAALSASLARDGSTYTHAEALGGRRSSEAGAASPNTAWRNDAFRAYADYMATPQFRAALDRLIAHAEARTTVIMCAEAVPWRCHRSLVADALLARGHEAREIVSEAKAAPHKLTAFARVEGDRVTYPPTTGTLL